MPVPREHNRRQTKPRALVFLVSAVALTPVAAANVGGSSTKIRGPWVS